MLTAEDIRLVTINVESYNADEIVFQLLLTFKHKIKPEHYILAGQLLEKKRRQNQSETVHILNHFN